MNAHTLSRTLATSMRPQLPSDRLSVPEMVERLKETRRERDLWDWVGQKSAIGSKAEREAGDAGAACDDRMDILRTAIIAAVDAQLESIGLTFAALQELNL